MIAPTGNGQEWDLIEEVVGRHWSFKYILIDKPNPLPYFSATGDGLRYQDAFVDAMKNNPLMNEYIDVIEATVTNEMPQFHWLPVGLQKVKKGYSK